MASERSSAGAFLPAVINKIRKFRTKPAYLIPGKMRSVLRHAIVAVHAALHMRELRRAHCAWSSRRSFGPAGWIKFRSGTKSQPINQTSDRQFLILFN